MNTRSAHGGHCASSSSRLSSEQMDNKVGVRLEVPSMGEVTFDAGLWQVGR